MKEYIDQFLTYLSVEKGFSDNTLDAYKNDLSQLVTFVEEESAKKGTAPSWESFTRQDMLSYQLQLKERNYAATTLARKVAAAKSFFKFMVADGPLKGKENPTQNVASPNVGRVLPKPISHAKVMKLLEQPAKLSTPEAKRDKAMLHLLYASGMRVSELISLNLGDVDTEGDTVRCFGKGQKERIIPIYRQAALAVEEYLKDARPHLFAEGRPGQLFQEHLLRFGSYTLNGGKQSLLPPVHSGKQLFNGGVSLGDQQFGRHAGGRPGRTRRRIPQNG